MGESCLQRRRGDSTHFPAQILRKCHFPDQLFFFCQNPTDPDPSYQAKKRKITFPTFTSQGPSSFLTPCNNNKQKILDSLNQSKNNSHAHKHPVAKQPLTKSENLKFNYRTQSIYGSLTECDFWTFNLLCREKGAASCLAPLGHSLRKRILHEGY